MDELQSYNCLCTRISRATRRISYATYIVFVIHNLIGNPGILDAFFFTTKYMKVHENIRYRWQNKQNEIKI